MSNGYVLAWNYIIRPCMEQYRYITNDMGDPIGEIGSECTRNLAAKDV
jgi:hypothetical protein